MPAIASLARAFPWIVSTGLARWGVAGAKGASWRGVARESGIPTACHRWVAMRRAPRGQRALEAGAEGGGRSAWGQRLVPRPGAAMPALQAVDAMAQREAM